jgi:hypothetical protein
LGPVSRFPSSSVLGPTHLFVFPNARCRDKNKLAVVKIILESIIHIVKRDGNTASLEPCRWKEGHGGWETKDFWNIGSPQIPSPDSWLEVYNPS